MLKYFTVYLLKPLICYPGINNNNNTNKTWTVFYTLTAAYFSFFLFLNIMLIK
jgi:hypothetical protein